MCGMLYWQSQEFSVGGTYGSNAVTITAGTGTQLVSVGYQNDGFAVQLYASQCFIFTNGTSALIQMVNTSPTSTNFWVYAVYCSTSNAADASKVAAPTVTSKKSQGSKKP